MMHVLYKNKILAILILVILIGGAYWSFTRSSKADQGAVTKQAVSQTSAPGAVDGPGKEFVTQLLAIQNISFKLDLFRDPVFMGLQDFSRELVQQETGRPNPFAPFNDSSRAGLPSGVANIFSETRVGTSTSGTSR